MRRPELIGGTTWDTTIAAPAGGSQALTVADIVALAGLAVLVLGVLGSMFPLWKSRTLSPRSIQRRVYWTGCVAGAALVFMSQLPDWRLGFVVALSITIVFGASAFFFTSHIKIGGRIYALNHDQRQPDPPPARDFPE